MLDAPDKDCQEGLSTLAGFDTKAAAERSSMLRWSTACVTALQAIAFPCLPPLVVAPFARVTASLWRLNPHCL